MKVLGTNGKSLTNDEIELAKSLGSTKGTVTITVQCPVCDGDVITEFAVGQKVRKVNCQNCPNKMTVSLDGTVVVQGPKGKKPTDAEDLTIRDDRICAECTYYRQWEPKRFWLIYTPTVLLIGLGLLTYVLLCMPSTMVVIGIAIVIGLCLALGETIADSLGLAEAYIKCKCVQATSVTRTSSAPEINPNLRCKFWKNNE